MNNILITGGKGQLGQCLQAAIGKNDTGFNYVFLGSSDLDVTAEDQVEAAFERYRPVYCINCAAYTAVDRAEDEQEQAFALNETAARVLAGTCMRYQTTLVHISTDFVFSGEASMPLRELHHTDPVNIYGLSKLKGEKRIEETLQQYYIIRTSWLYSEKANNFVKTMLKLSHSKNELSVVADQVGTPTYAMDLAGVILALIRRDPKQYGVYHYSNEGVASWYDFAKAVFEFAEIDMKVMPVDSAAFVTRAKRPHYSVLDKTKIKQLLGMEIPYWRDSLNKCIQQI